MVLKKLNTKPFYYFLLFGILIACNKDVGLVTEVEFTISEQHDSEGFVNIGLSTSVTVIPEELLEDYEYFFSYNITNGAGYYEDNEGTRYDEGDRIPFDPLSISLVYVGTQTGEHTVRINAEDTFGFTEETTLSYSITDVPVQWTASSPVSQLLLTDTADITVVLGGDADNPDVDYERSYRIRSGSGALLDGDGSAIVLDDFISIVPGSYELVFEPSELGDVVIDFVLRDSNGQELTSTVELEVVDELTPVTSIMVSPETLTLTVGQTMDNILTATITPDNAANPGVIWSSSDTSIATVDQNGVVTAVSLGEATIIATSDDNSMISDTAEITVTAEVIDVPVTGITVEPETLSLTVGQQTDDNELTATVAPTNATNVSVTWESEDTDIATVDPVSGVVTAVSVGMVTIMATSNDNNTISNTAEITVTAEVVDIPVTEVTVNARDSNDNGWGHAFGPYGNGRTRRCNEQQCYMDPQVKRKWPL